MFHTRRCIILLEVWLVLVQWLSVGQRKAFSIKRLKYLLSSDPSRRFQFLPCRERNIMACRRPFFFLRMWFSTMISDYSCPIMKPFRKSFLRGWEIPECVSIGEVVDLKIAALSLTIPPRWKPRPNLEKTRYCEMNKKGCCMNGAACSFAHSQQDKRDAPKTALSQTEIGTPNRPTIGDWYVPVRRTFVDFITELPAVRRRARSI